MKPIHLGLFMLLTVKLLHTHAQSDLRPVLYLIPGTGADGRCFGRLDIDSAYEVVVLEHLVLLPGERLDGYARRMAEGRIDTTRDFSLLGVSLGGMVAVEIAKTCPPHQLFLVASAKGKNELPFRYRMFRHLPLYKLFGDAFYKAATNLMALLRA
ncbi:MAG: hypothetical protein OHK0039_48960 [Bacteroidia bacterium]